MRRLTVAATFLVIVVTGCATSPEPAPSDPAPTVSTAPSTTTTVAPTTTSSAPPPTTTSTTVTTAAPDDSPGQESIGVNETITITVLDP